MDVTRPVLEGSVAVRDGRRLSFAEYGSATGLPLIWMHGTPGARRQVPLEARAYAEEHDLRIICIDRPGIGSSTPHLYQSILDWTGDLEQFLDVLRLDEVRCVGLSGGAPYVLAAAAALPDRVTAVGVMGGVAPTRGADAVTDGLVQMVASFAPLLEAARVPLGIVVSGVVRALRPFGGPALDFYGLFQPPGDKALLARPEFRAMFLDDLLNGSRFQMSAPVNDLILFLRPWGFDLGDVGVPVHWWHGAADHIVPLAHGRHVVARLPNARLVVAHGESHLGGLAMTAEVLGTLAETPRTTTLAF